jgi:hypothetical protein
MLVLELNFLVILVVRGSLISTLDRAVSVDQFLGSWAVNRLSGFVNHLDMLMTSTVKLWLSSTIVHVLRGADWAGDYNFR